jgi:hypothetical protein
MSARIQSRLLFLSLASLAAPACHSSPKGVRVDLDMAGFETTAHALRLTVSADPGGFADNSPSLPDPSVAISYNDTDDLVMTFDARQGFKFTGKISFRLETGNTHPLTISALAEAFNVTGAKIASGKGSGVALPAGGDAELPIMLSADSDGTTADTTVVDLATTAVDGAITGPSSSAPPATVAICDVLGSNSGGAVVIGVPGATSPTMQVTGAVYVIFNGTSTVDLSMPPAGEELQVYGVNDGDQLGAAVGCFDFDQDGADDLVIGAPGAHGANNEPGAGRVYVIHGNSGLKSATIDLSQNQADVEWVGTTAQAHLGAQLLTADLQGGSQGEILIAAPGEGTGTVHLVVPTPMPGVPVAPRPLGGTTGHVTFSGIAPASIAIGDLDGDGTSDGGSEVIFGDPGFLDANNARVGAVTIFANVDPSGATAFDTGATGAAGPARRITGMVANDSLGAAVLALDVSAQGADLIVGASGENNGAGAVRIFEHNAQIFSAPQAPKWIIDGAIAGGRFGATLAAAPSATVTAAPLVIGAPASVSGSKDAAGAVYSYKRLAKGGLPVLLEKISGAAAMDRLGTAIASARIDGNDPVADVLALAPFATGADAQMQHTGVAYVAITH